jgi:ubiquitin C-terminal hydrolase
MNAEKILESFIKKGQNNLVLSNTSLPLVNIFNTCFVNVVLQALFHTMPLTTCLLKGNFQEALQHLDDPRIMLFISYIQMNDWIWTHDHQKGAQDEDKVLMRPANFVNEMRKYLPLYDWGRQHDAQETLIWVLNVFHDCMSRLVVHRIEGEPCNKLDRMRIEATLQWANNYKGTKKYGKNKEYNKEEEKDKEGGVGAGVGVGVGVGQEPKEQIEVLLRNKVLEYKSEYSSILKIFGGQFLERLNCEGCNEINHKYVSFLSSELAIPTNNDEGSLESLDSLGPDEINIEELLEHQCSLEKLDAENLWTCDKCNVKNRPFRRMSYWQLPQVLILSLKRFSYEQIGSNFISKKINTKVIYDPFGFLDMDPYLSNSLSETKYVLYAIICHSGTLNSGHYYAYCRNLRAKKPIWLKYNDEEITNVTNLDCLITNHAYVLFYQRFDTL